MPKERYVSPEERQKIIDEMRLINLLDNTPNTQNKSQTITNENDKEIPKERQKIIDEIRLI